MAATKRPIICLCMIVKNEAHIVEEGLTSTLPYIDRYAISDTGSTDGTPELITKFFATRGIPGKVYHDKWVNFAVNRSRSLKRCKGDYALVIDADDKIEGKLVYPSPMTADGYYFNISTGGSGISFTRLQLFRIESRWIYEGELHEYPKCKGKKFPKLETVQGDYYMLFRTLGDRSKNPLKYHNDAAKFEKMLQKNPHGPRNWFYYGRSLFDAGCYEKAITAFDRRARMKNGWAEEVYYSLFQIGNCYEKLNYSNEKIEQAYLQAGEAHPGRAEPWYALVLRFRDLDRTKAIKYAIRGMKCRYDSTYLFVQKEVYDHLLRRELEKLLEAAKEKAEMKGIESKGTIALFTGYGNPYGNEESRALERSEEGANEVSTSEEGGKDLSVRKLASFFLQEGYRVLVFAEVTFSSRPYRDRDLLLHPVEKLKEMLSRQEKILCVIVWRYLYFYHLFQHNLPPTILWVHDQCPHPYHNFVELPDRGRGVLMKAMETQKLSMVYTNHEQLLATSSIYRDLSGINRLKEGKIIPYGVDLPSSTSFSEKKSLRLFCTSSLDRMGDNLLSLFQAFHEKYPISELHIKHASPERDSKEDEKRGIFWNASDKEAEFTKSDIWFAPVNYQETCNHSALRALANGCLIVAPQIGAFREILPPEFLCPSEKLLDRLIELAQLSEEEKNNLRQKGVDHACQFSWEKHNAAWKGVILSLIDEAPVQEGA
jgi:glycosyltransferase involved in cell wall biosynthesis